MSRTFVLLFLLTLCTPIANADVDPKLSARFDELLVKLDDDDWRVRDEAATAVTALPPEVLPLVEAALRDPKLSAEVRHRLEGMIDDLRRYGAISKKTRQREQAFIRYRKHVLDQYDRHGVRDARWDDIARDALVRHIAVDRERGVGRGTIRRNLQALQKAVDAGCTDPLVRLALAIERQSDRGAKFDQFDELNATTEQLLASGYPAQFKIIALVRRAQSRTTRWELRPGPHRDAYLADGDAAAALIPQLKGAVYRRDDGLVRLTMAVFQLHVGPNAPLDERRDGLAKAIGKATDDPIQPLLFLANANTVIAPTVGYATRRGQAYFALAEKAATDALAIDPNSVPAAQWQLASINSRQRPQDFLRCYKTTLTLDPDNAETRRIMIQHLTHNGSAAQLMAYADECLATKAWGETTPVLAVTCLSRVAGDVGTDERTRFMSSPEIWARIRDAYEGTLRVYPTDASLRSFYAYFACEAEQWAVANEQFELIGDDINPEPFQTEASAGYLRRKAKRMAARQK